MKSSSLMLAAALLFGVMAGIVSTPSNDRQSQEFISRINAERKNYEKELPKDLPMRLVLLVMSQRK